MTTATLTELRRPSRRSSEIAIRRHRLPACPVTGKARYRDKHQAHDGLASAKRSRQQDEFLGIPSRRREVRVYLCPHCAGWHATSIPFWNAA